MKRVLFLAAVAVCAIGCNKETEKVGRTIVFRTSTEYDNGPETRTEYANVYYGGKQRIDWVSGDKFRIKSDVARCENGTTDYSDYVVTGVTPGTGNKLSSSFATVTALDRNSSLQWGSGTHNFYCVYPSPLDNSDVSFTSTNAVTFTIPGTQTYTANGTTLKPDMDYAYMYAAVQTSSSSTVNLAFKPMFTAFQFTVDSADDATMTVTSFTLSSASTAMTGTATATMTANTTSSSSTVSYSNFPTATAANKSITVTFNDGNGITITQGSPITFTVFALPRTYDDLTVSFTTSAGETKTLDLTQNNAGISFNPGYKYDITNLALPGAWTYRLQLTKGSSPSSTIPDVTCTRDEWIGNSNGAIGKIQVFRSRGGIEEEVAWDIYFSTTEPAVGDLLSPDWSSTPLPDPAGNDWLTFIDDYRDYMIQYYQGSYPGISVEVLEQLFGSSFPVAGSSGVEIGGDLQYLIDWSSSSSASTMKSSLQGNNLGTVDLSTLALDNNGTSFTSGHTSSTANCYVINGYGTFLIPIVYGNGIQNGTAARAYNGVSALDCLTTFINADGNPITSDYILSDTGLSKSGTYSGRVVWQNVPAGSEIIDDEDIVFHSSAPSGASLSCPYLQFSISQENIKPGNVVIALYDEGNEKVLWSWHIWITAESFSTKDVYYTQSAYLRFLSCNLGWMPPLICTTGADRAQYGIIVASNSGKVVDVFKITHRYDSGQVGTAFYRNPLYNFGRKDPFPSFSSDGYDREIASNYYEIIMDGTNVSSTSDALSIQIRNPNKYRPTYSWDPMHNLWNATYTGNSITRVTKTIYDPCPRGFCVPRQDGFDGFYHNNTVYGDRVSASGDLPEGYNMSTGGWESSQRSLFIPNVKLPSQSYAGYWSAQPTPGFTHYFTILEILSSGTLFLQSQNQLTFCHIRPVREE